MHALYSKKVASGVGRYFVLGGPSRKVCFLQTEVSKVLSPEEIGPNNILQILIFLHFDAGMQHHRDNKCTKDLATPHWLKLHNIALTRTRKSQLIANHLSVNVAPSVITHSTPLTVNAHLHTTL